MKGLIKENEVKMDNEEPESSEGDMRRGVLLLLFTVACTGLIYQATSFMLPKLIEMRLTNFVGEGLIGVGLIVSTIYFLSGGMQLVGGWLADKYHLKSVYLVCWISPNSAPCNCWFSRYSTNFSGLSDDGSC